MPPEIVTAAAGLLGRIAAEPVKAAAMRRAAVVNALKKLHLDPNRPPKDFDGLYAYALVEELYGRPRAALRLFQDQYVQRSFARSFETGDWSHVQKEIELTVERNRETAEFGHLGVDVAETLQRFTEKFQELVDRSRDAHHTRVENKIDTLLDEVRRTRSAEEAHRLVEEPGRAAVSPAERLSSDAQAWFVAVGYRVERTWKSSDDTSALMVNVPTRRPGRFDRVVVLCVDGELSLYHLDLLERITAEEEAAEGWGVAQLRISEAARRKAADSEEQFSCFSFDELIDLEVDFEPYIEWLQNETKSRKIDTRYIPLSCQKDEVDPATGEALGISNYHWQDGGLDRYVETWLTDPAKKHLSLLGEFGMGKSWFCLHFASKLAEAWKDAKERGLPRPRMPLVIPLRDYAKQTSVAALLSEFFFNKHKIGMRSYDVFSVLNRMGRLLLLFDGFDEMASRIDRNTMVANFWELAKAVEPGAKVLLSSRTEHFPEAKEARDLFEARVTASPSDIATDGPTFEIVELVPFDDTQIQGMLGHLLVDENKIKSVLANEHVRDLMRRPVMSELVIDALPEIESGAPVNLTRIYLYAIQRKMDRDVTSQRTFTSRADKLLFLSEVSWEMLRTNRLTLNYRDFPDRLRACFGSVVQNRKDLDYWEQDMRNQGMLVRNAEGDYGPSHKSLLEFLTAYKYAAELGLLSGDFLGIIPQSGDPNAESYSWSTYFDARRADGSLPAIKSIQAELPEKLCENFGADEFNPVVYDFLATMVREHPGFRQVLIDHIKSTRDLGNPESLGGNCANLLGLAQGTLEGADLRGVDLTGFRSIKTPQPSMSLIGANLQGAMLNSVNLAEIDKLDADFTAASLKKSRFLDSACRPFLGNIHPNGMVGALVINSYNDVERRRICLWRDGDLKLPPEEIQLRSADIDIRPYSWLQGARYFLGATADWWGYSDGTASYIISSETGAILNRLAGCVTRAIFWEGRQALVRQDEEARDGFGWKIVDLETGEIIAEIDDVEVEDATHFTYFENDFGLQVWARSSHNTKILQYGPGQSAWNEIGILPVGKDDSVSRRAHATQVMHDGRSVYMADRSGGVMAFELGQVEPAMADLSQNERVEFVCEGDVVVIACAQRFSVWDVQSGAWRRRWDAELGGRFSGAWESPDHSRLLVSCSSGDLLIYSLLSGEIVSAASFNPHLKGAVFSTSSELRAEELNSARRAGAVVDGVDSS